MGLRNIVKQPFHEPADSIDIVKRIDEAVKPIWFDPIFANHEIRHMALELEGRLFYKALRSGEQKVLSFIEPASFELIAKPSRRSPTVYIFSDRAEIREITIYYRDGIPMLHTRIDSKGRSTELIMQFLDYIALLLHPEVRQLIDGGKVEWHSNIFAELDEAIYNDAKIIAEKSYHRIIKPTDIFLLNHHMDCDWNIYFDIDTIDEELLKRLLHRTVGEAISSKMNKNHIAGVTVNRNITAVVGIPLTEMRVQIDGTPTKISHIYIYASPSSLSPLLEKYSSKISETATMTSRLYVLAALALNIYLSLDSDPS